MAWFSWPALLGRLVGTANQPDQHDGMSAADDAMDAPVRTTFEVAGMLTRIGGEHDLSLTQLRVLGILRDRRARVTELAAYLGLDKSTLSGLIDRAQRRGLVARGKNPQDGRVVEVYLTPDSSIGSPACSTSSRPARCAPMPKGGRRSRADGPAGPRSS